MNLRTLVQAFGAATLLFLYSLWPHLAPHHVLLYHSFLPIRSVICGLLIDLGVSTLMVALLFGFLQQSDSGKRSFLWALVAAVLAPPLVLNAAFVVRQTVPQIALEVLFYATLLVALSCRWLRPAVYLRLVHAGRVLLLLVGCSLFWIIPELAFMAIRPQPHDVRVPMTTATTPVSQRASSEPHSRIVWLMLDELSYDQVFEHRVAGLALPAFDDLRKKSILFSNLQPVGYSTDRVVPSLFLGQPIEEIKSNLEGKLFFRQNGDRNWVPFEASRTVFADARRLGWSTGLVGWYNPYCRILAGTLNYCFWRAGGDQWAGISSSQSILQNAIAPFVGASPVWPNRSLFPAEEKHQADLITLMAQANILIRDQQVSFIFIHLPIPHPPGIYDRTTGRMRLGGSYLDNLALADRSLAELRTTLAATPSFSQTTLIVSSDHSWRLGLWQPTAAWTKEEQAATHDHFDPRPVLMVHYPGQSEEKEVSRPVNAMQVHVIVEQILRGGKQLDTLSEAAGAAKPD